MIRVEKEGFEIGKGFTLGEDVKHRFVKDGETFTGKIVGYVKLKFTTLTIIKDRYEFSTEQETLKSYSERAYKDFEKVVLDTEFSKEKNKYLYYTIQLNDDYISKEENNFKKIERYSVKDKTCKKLLKAVEDYSKAFFINESLNSVTFGFDKDNDRFEASFDNLYSTGYTLEECYSELIDVIYGSDEYIAKTSYMEKEDREFHSEF